jgi:integrase
MMSASIVKRGNGRYAVVVEEGRQPARRCVECRTRVWTADHDGDACPKCGGVLGEVAQERRQRWHGPYKRRKDAEAAASELDVAQASGTYRAPTKLTVREYIVDLWLPAIESTIRPSTFSSYSDIVTRHVVPRVGHLQLRQLGPEHLNALYGELGRSGRRDGEGLSATSVQYTHRVVTRALRDAVRWHHIVRNPAQDADPPRAARSTMRYWTAQQLRIFLEHDADDRLQALWTLLATTGMRRGEACGLAWTDLDLDAGRLSITRTLVVVGREVAFSEPKTERSRRSLTLDAGTVAALRAWRTRQREERLAFGPGWENEHGLVFSAPDGRPLNPKAVSHAFTVRARAAGLPVIRLHDLRHSYAAAALAAGEHPRVVADRLGHSSTQITNDIYSHVSREVEDAAAHRIAASILGGSTFTHHQ